VLEASQYQPDSITPYRAICRYGEEACLADRPACCFSSSIGGAMLPAAHSGTKKCTRTSSSSSSSLKIKILIPKEVKEEIVFLNLKKAPGIDKITPKIIKELPKKGLFMLTYIYNAIIIITYWPKQLKTAEIILIPKQGKDAREVSLHRQVNLLSIVNNPFEKLILRRLNADLKPDKWMP
jgi:hypothetical protein